MNSVKKCSFRRVLCTVMCVVFAVLSCVLPVHKASAEQSLDDLKSQYSKLEKEIAKNEKKLSQVESDINTNEKKLKTITSQIEGIKSQITLLDSEISVLNGSIGELQPQITELSGQIHDVETSIELLDDSIVTAQETADSTKTQLLSRLREDYLAGGSSVSMLEALLTSEDLSTYFARTELLYRVSENDAELINQLDEQAKTLKSLQDEAKSEKADLEFKKSQLDSKMSQLRSNQNELESSMSAAESKKSSLNGKYNEVNELLGELDEDSEEYKAEIKRQRQEMAAIANEIDNYVEKYGSSQGDEIPASVQAGRYSDSLKWPVPYSGCAISCGFGYYSDGTPHYGMDIVVRDSNGNNISNGKDIIACQSGTVIRAYNDGGWNGGYGNYCIIDHGDGMLTLYAHCKRLLVSNGQIVAQGQKIAEIGLTGNTTGYHLHLEVRIKNADGSVTRVNPANYL